MTDGSGMRASLKGNVEGALRFFASEAEWDGLNLAETEFVLEETLKCYGSTFDGAMILELFKFYRRYLGMADVGRRQQLLTRMTEFLSNGQQHRSIALLCFISADTDGQITSGAALDLAMVMPADKGGQNTGSGRTFGMLNQNSRERSEFRFRGPNTWVRPLLVLS